MPVESPIKLFLVEEEYVVACLLVEIEVANKQSSISLKLSKAGKLVEHWDGIQEVEIDNESNGVLAFLRSNADWNIKKIHRVIGEGNYVLVQSEGTSKTLHSVIYDLFRVKKGSIVEQWTISQPIPKEMVHCNGML